jgi:hypothetical protein
VFEKLGPAELTAAFHPKEFDIDPQLANSAILFYQVENTNTSTKWIEMNQTFRMEIIVNFEDPVNPKIVNMSLNQFILPPYINVCTKRCMINGVLLKKNDKNNRGIIFLEDMDSLNWLNTSNPFSGKYSSISGPGHFCYSSNVMDTCELDRANSYAILFEPKPNRKLPDWKLIIILCTSILGTILAAIALVIYYRYKRRSRIE